MGLMQTYAFGQNTVDISFDSDVEILMDESELARIFELVLCKEGITRTCMVSISFVNEEHMRKLNAQWRGVDAPTDVLSLECERPFDPELSADEPAELGDIVLSPSYIQRQAHLYQTTPTYECCLLLIHALLHLLGYDHLSDAEAAIMEAREDELCALALAEFDGALSEDTAAASPIKARAPHVITTRHKGVDI